MRRIRAVAGHAVSLEADWNDMGEISAAGRILSTWGLNRVVGGVALAGADAVKNLKSVRVIVSFDIEKGYAKYEGGVLELGLTAYCDGLSECYEHEIAAALTGA